MEPLPERVETERLVLRMWTDDDVEAMRDAVTASIEHLRPWMPWVELEPLSLDDRRALIADWRETWAAGGDLPYAMFTRDGTAVGGTGLHRRSRDPSILEIGYWVHVDHVGRGYATEASRALVETAFTLPWVSAVDIHHDRANVASRAVPARLGFRFLGEHPDPVDAPGEEGVDCHWRIVRPRTDGVEIRTATAADRAAILDVVREGFRGGDEEVDIVERTWAAPGAIPDGLELVAVDRGTIVGHVLGARADVAGREVLAVAPLVVAPVAQGNGIGSALIREVLARAVGGTWPLVALLGDPAYYSRFGFEPAGPLGITYPQVDPATPHFQVFRLKRWDESVRGIARYCWER